MVLKRSAWLGLGLWVGLVGAISAAEVSAPADLNIRIVGTASFQGRHTALIEDLNTLADSFYKVGDPIYGYLITDISSKGIKLTKDGREAFVPFESTPPAARATASAAAPTPEPTQLAAAIVPNSYLLDGETGVSPNFYSDAPETTTRWDLFTPGKREETPRKKPGIAGEIPAASSSVASAALGKFVMPVARYKRMSSGFGYRKHPIGGGTKMHKGIDFSANRGTRILSADNGVVTFSGWKGGYGYCVIVNHQNGYETLYGHCSKLLADVGDNVQRGDLIAEVGSTGASTGNHLHFEIHKNKVAIDPAQFFSSL